MSEQELFELALKIASQISAFSKTVQESDKIMQLVQKVLMVKKENCPQGS